MPDYTTTPDYLDELLASVDESALVALLTATLDNADTSRS